MATTPSYDPLSPHYIGWPKHALRALRADDAADLHSCFAACSFEGNNERDVVLQIHTQVTKGLLGRGLSFAHIYDAGLVMVEGDTLLDMAHRNRKENVKAEIRSFKGKAHNMIEQEEQELQLIEKARLKKKMEEEGRL